MMFHTIMNNRERQEDEITALSSIYKEDEFFCTRHERIKCTFNIFLDVPKKLEVKFISSPTDAASIVPHKIFVEHLPPIKFCIQLPDTYPSHKPPKFWLCITWLSPWEISSICQKLDEIWEENKGNEILFLWLNFLQNHFFTFLNMEDSLDVSFMHAIYLTPNDHIKHLISLSDSRAINGALFINPMILLRSYDKVQHIIEFDRNFHTCPICFMEYIGLKCIELKNCRHIYCRSCTQEHIHTRISENIKVICPTLDCSCEINISDIKTLCPDLVSRYEELMLQVALDTMEDVIYCPRISCQYPVIRDMEEIAVICPSCNYCFCIYCHKVYHGIAPCEMASDNVKKLTNDYKSSDNNAKKLLEKKYGKRQIQSIEKQLTVEYLKDNTKSCPNCHTLISKTSGCNKMICSHCQSNFCWLCGQEITSINVYKHFTTNNSSCFGRLFNEDDTEDFDYDIEQNIIWFEPNFHFD